MTTDAEAKSQHTRDTFMSEIRDRAAIPVWSDSLPNYAGLVGVGRAVAYARAKAGDVPTIRVGSRVVVPVPALRRLLGDLDG